MDLERLTDFSGWRILKTRHKVLCTNGTNSGTILATLAIVEENNLRPEDIRSVRIRATPRQAAHTVTTGKKYPRTAENADHSTFYGVAFAIKERSFGPESGRPEYFTDPVILELIEKIGRRMGGDQAKMASDSLMNGDLRKAVSLVLKYYDKTYQHSLEKREKMKIRIVPGENFNMTLLLGYMVLLNNLKKIIIRVAKLRRG